MVDLNNGGSRHIPSHDGMELSPGPWRLERDGIHYLEIWILPRRFPSIYQSYSPVPQLPPETSPKSPSQKGDHDGDQAAGTVGSCSIAGDMEPSIDSEGLGIDDGESTIDDGASDRESWDVIFERTRNVDDLQEGDTLHRPDIAHGKAYLITLEKESARASAILARNKPTRGGNK